MSFVGAGVVQMHSAAEQAGAFNSVLAAYALGNGVNPCKQPGPALSEPVMLPT